jgi:gamma-glutamyltranspeptidase/glutathione hydrolase
LRILEAGGNAYDAAVAAVLVSCVVEPALTSLGGGGFLLAAPANAKPGLFDFFVQTPRLKRQPNHVDFRQVGVHFGDATQHFNIGLGAAGVPGMPAGLWHVQRTLGRLTMSEVVTPAVELARQGHEINAFQAWCLGALEAIMFDQAAGRALFAQAVARAEQKPASTAHASATPRLRQEGERLEFPALADLLDYLGRHGEKEFYEGEVAAAVSEACADHGGYLNRADFRGYQVEERKALAIRYRDYEVLTNPSPSSGGSLLAFSLALLEAGGPQFPRFGSAEWLARMVRVQDLTNRARRVGFDSVRHDRAAVDAWLSAESLQPWVHELARERRYGEDFLGTTTHISVLDAAGNAASVTSSVGQGCGYIMPGTDTMLNNMLGEADLNPDGFHAWVPDQRLSSMMSPTVVRQDGRVRLVLGTGGANRIRTAIGLVLHQVLDLGVDLETAVGAPRLHLSDGEHAVLDLEGGFDPAEYQAMIASGEYTVRPWSDRNMYFGGVHTIAWDERGVKAVPDARRSGAMARG